MIGEPALGAVVRNARQFYARATRGVRINVGVPNRSSVMRSRHRPIHRGVLRHHHHHRLTAESDLLHCHTRRCNHREMATLRRFLPLNAASQWVAAFPTAAGSRHAANPDASSLVALTPDALILEKLRAILLIPGNQENPALCHGTAV
jgi:hypothetical protein